MQDVVAYLFSDLITETTAKDDFEAHPFYFHPPVKSPVLQKRASTVPPEGKSQSIENLPCLRIPMNYIPRTPRGIIFGSDALCDVVISSNSVSQFHISITFDAQRRVVVQDLCSSHGTQVTYNDKGNGYRSGFTWVIQPTGYQVIELSNDIKFRIVLPQHPLSSKEFIEKADKFREGSDSPETLMEALQLHTKRTASVAGQLSRDPIYLKEQVGQGSYGVVYSLWDVSTGVTYARKEPSPRALRRGHYEYYEWEKEVKILKSLDHVSTH